MYVDGSGRSDSTSMRFTEDVEKLIKSQRGKNFSEKFHNLVRNYEAKTLDLVETFAISNKQIEERKRKLSILNKMVYKVQEVVTDITNVKMSIQTINECVDALTEIQGGNMK